MPCSLASLCLTSSYVCYFSSLGCAYKIYAELLMTKLDRFHACTADHMQQPIRAKAKVVQAFGLGQFNAMS